MKEINSNLNLADKVKNQGRELKSYPAGEDIYIKLKKEGEIDPENIAALKELNEKDETGTDNEENFTDDVPGSDLDISGSELDDEQEKIGSEDEENNYYSLGDDNHNDLEENRGE